MDEITHRHLAHRFSQRPHEMTTHITDDEDVPLRYLPVGHEYADTRENLPRPKAPNKKKKN